MTVRLDKVSRWLTEISHVYINMLTIFFILTNNNMHITYKKAFPWLLVS